MPKHCYALWIVKNGQVENAEFCVWDKDSYFEEMWKFKKKVDTRELRAGHYTAWVKYYDHFKQVNLNSVTVE
jgi:hypothetical protein